MKTVCFDNSQFWIQNGKSALVLAPMEGVTDAPMRTLMTEMGAFTHCVSEFLRISHEVLPHRVYLNHCPELLNDSKTPSATPVIFQLLGGNSELLANSARAAVKAGARAIDLNFGCPAPTVNRNDGGATLLKYPHRIYEIVKAVREALPAKLPVSAKLRLGWDDPGVVYENARQAIEAGANWITIHGRTKIQGYQPPAYWEPIGRLRNETQVPIVANGDIWTFDDFRRCRDQTGCEHFMMGRGAIADPLLPLRVAQELGIPLSESRPDWCHFSELKKTSVDPRLTLGSLGLSQGLSPEPSLTQTLWPATISRFAELCEDFIDRPNYTVCRIKQWMKLVNSRRPLNCFEQLKRAETVGECQRLLALV